jgi:predicted dehydrogenase
MPSKLRWGILSTARIGTRKVIPGMQQAASCEIAAIASRDRGRAREAADALGIPKAYGSYEELLADPGIDAVNNPLPNHMHVPWSIRAAEAGKHVLCEKPIAHTADEAQRLVEARDRAGVLIQEAFMVRTHPQWIAAADIAGSGRIGDLQLIAGFFSYFNADPTNIRNVLDWGGGGLMDIGCYIVHTSRMILGREPIRAAALIQRDPEMAIDRLTSLMLDFGGPQAIGTCSTQLVPYQRVQIVGTRGRIEIPIPFNAPPDKPTRIFVDDGTDLAGATAETIEFPVCDQYTIQGELFSRAVLDGEPAPYPLEDSVRNMQVIDALVRSADSGAWVTPGDDGGSRGSRTLEPTLPVSRPSSS